jgi:hypothetical protein
LTSISGPGIFHQLDTTQYATSQDDHRASTTLKLQDARPDVGIHKCSPKGKLVGLPAPGSSVKIGGVIGILSEAEISRLQDAGRIPAILLHDIQLYMQGWRDIGAVYGASVGVGTVLCPVEISTGADRAHPSLPLSVGLGPDLICRCAEPKRALLLRGVGRCACGFLLWGHPLNDDDSSISFALVSLQCLN